MNSAIVIREILAGIHGFCPCELVEDVDYVDVTDCVEAGGAVQVEAAEPDFYCIPAWANEKIMEAIRDEYYGRFDPGDRPRYPVIHINDYIDDGVVTLGFNLKVWVYIDQEGEIKDVGLCWGDVVAQYGGHCKVIGHDFDFENVRKCI